MISETLENEHRRYIKESIYTLYEKQLAEKDEELVTLRANNKGVLYDKIKKQNKEIERLNILNEEAIKLLEEQQKEIVRYKERLNSNCGWRYDKLRDCFTNQMGDIR